jgi:hypothetical protein
MASRSFWHRSDGAQTPHASRNLSSASSRSDGSQRSPARWQDSTAYTKTDRVRRARERTVGLGPVGSGSFFPRRFTDDFSGGFSPPFSAAGAAFGAVVVPLFWAEAFHGAASVRVATSQMPRFIDSCSRIS